MQMVVTWTALFFRRVSSKVSQKHRRDGTLTNLGLLRRSLEAGTGWTFYHTCLRALSEQRVLLPKRLLLSAYNYIS